ncbi:MAG: hypothetical protein HOV83_39710 [Catenulispora sp.]|nr:hypothetical protein [Catenulispora sp.]
MSRTSAPPAHPGRSPLSLLGALLLAFTTLVATLPGEAAAAAPPKASASSPAGGTVTIGGRCLDDANWGTTAGNTIQIWDCNGSTAQNWTWNGDGTLTVLGMCAEITGGSNANGALLQLWTCDGSAAEQFKWLPDGTVYAVKSAKCLQVQGGPVANGARIGLEPCDPSQATQVWNAATAPGPRYSLSAGSAVSFANPDDTPASVYTDADGTFYYQSSHSLYGAKDSRSWDYWTGSNFDTAGAAAIDKSGTNPDTTALCNNSPTGVNATYAPSGSGYAERNYCDLSGTWVDPDTGNWYGLIHNEFTPQPFGDGLHYDAIDYAVSTDHGKTWTIPGHAITSPYSTRRNDTAAFPYQTYYYGDGDQRLFVDNASGYFYAFYATRVLDKSGGGTVWEQHVARAPISGKMATGTWSKWYNGAWSQPGVGGAESDMIPSEGLGTGFLDASSDYAPAAVGTVSQQVAVGTMPDNSQLAVMNVAWDAYLGKYIATPQNNVAQATGTKTPLHFYATDDLATQKWTDMGLVPNTGNGSWYRWMLDSGNLTSSTVVGKTFRSYCDYYCTTYDGEYQNITIAPKSAADLPTPPVTAGLAYQIAAGDGLLLAQSGSGLTTVATNSTSASQHWNFVATGDGYFTIANAASGQVLGVGTGTGGRAWGSGVSLGTVSGGGPAIGQQWALLPILKSPSSSGSSTATGAYRIVNRYSGLALSLTSQAVATAPQRSWDNAGSAGDTRPVSAQTITFTGATGTPKTDLAVNRPTTASSVQSGGNYAAANATDGDVSTRWSSAFSDPQWVQVDLGSTHTVNEVVLSWEAAYGKAFQIQVSGDGVSWSTISSTTTGSGGTQDLTGLNGSGRYVRMYGTVRGTGYGYSLWSLQVYGS